MKTNLTRTAVAQCIYSVIVVSLCVLPAGAADLTLFGGLHHLSDLKLRSTKTGASGLLQNFDPRDFGVFGVRVGHKIKHLKLLGGEHTIAYAPNFVNSDSHAWIYHSNLRVQLPLEVFKPYGTGGLGLVSSAGSSVTSLGTEFAFNYGGGVNFMIGPVGANFDLRGYTLPSIHVSGFDIQDNLNFLQVSAGIVLVIK